MQLKFADNTILDGVENATLPNTTTVKLEFSTQNIAVEQALKILQDKKMDTFYIVNGETTSSAYLHFVNIIGIVGIDPATNRIVAVMGQKDATDIKVDELQATVDALTLASLGV
mgnify:FL=1